MISISGKQWEEKKVSKNLIEKLKQDHKFSEIISKLIISRNFDNDEISSIENNSHLINIFKNNSDFNQSINLLCESINNKENICILGDYDVDGSVATSLLINFFQHIKQPFFYYIPDREKDGYGASKVLFEKLIKKKTKINNNG
jgi:single-stranded-DNA-specific exonuclease